jgi:hypothetical protein
VGQEDDNKDEEGEEEREEEENEEECNLTSNSRNCYLSNETIVISTQREPVSDPTPTDPSSSSSDKLKVKDISLF